MIVLWVASILFIIFASWLIVALVSYFVRELTPIPHPSQHVHRVSLSEMSGIDSPENNADEKESFVSTQINIPPPLSISHQNYSPTFLSGMGSSWKPLRGVMPKRMRRFPHMRQE